MSKTTTKATIAANITTNGQQEITAAKMRTVLNAMVDDYAENEAVQTDIDSIDVDDMGDARAKSIDIDELPKVCGFPIFIIGTAAPAVTPDFIGQVFIDKTNEKVYVATGVSNASSFKVLN